MTCAHLSKHNPAQIMIADHHIQLIKFNNFVELFSVISLNLLCLCEQQFNLAKVFDKFNRFLQFVCNFVWLIISGRHRILEPGSKVM